MNQRVTFRLLKNRLILSLFVITIAAVVLMIVALSGCMTPNSAPAIVDIEISQGYLVAGESNSIQVWAYDADGDDLVYTWTAAAGDVTGEGDTIEWTAPAALGDYTINLSVSDGKNVATAILNLDVIANEPPVIESLSAPRLQVNRGETVAIECAASDADGDDLVYTWQVPDGVILGMGPAVAWQAPVELGAYNIEVTVDDGRGGVAADSIVLEVNVNHAPEIDSLMPAEWSVLYGQTTTVTCVATDPDGDPLTYEWSAEEGEIIGEGDVIEWLATTDCGEITVVSVSVYDSRGGEADYGISIRGRKPG